MVYSTAADVKLLIDTSLEDTTIEGLIEKADAEIDDELAREGVSVPSPTPSLIKRASENIATAKVLYRRTTPDHYTIANNLKQTDSEKQIEKFEKAGYAAIRDYIKQSKAIPSIFSIIENKTDTNEES